MWLKHLMLQSSCDHQLMIHSVLRGGVCTVCVFAGLLLSAQGSVLQLCYAELLRARFCTRHADKSDWQIRESVMVHTPLWLAKREREMQLGAAKLWERTDQRRFALPAE